MTKLHSEGLPQKMERYTPASPAPYVVEDELTFLDFLIIVSQRKKLIAIVTVICALSGVLIAFLRPVEYTATVIILPPQGSSSMSSMLATQLAGMSSVGGVASSALGLKNLDEMYVSMLKSRSVEDAVIKRYGLMAEYHKDYLVQARKALEKHAKIDGSELLRPKSIPRGRDCERLCRTVPEPFSAPCDNRSIPAARDF